jgi:hypothetical protein
VQGRTPQEREPASARERLRGGHSERHGLTAQRVLLPDETQDELARLVGQLRRHFPPVGAAEVLLVERIVAATWGLRCVYRIEAGVVSWQFHDVVAQRASQEADVCTSDLLESLAICTVTDEARPQRALAREAEAARRRDPRDAAVGAAVGRSMCRAMQELERLQAARSRSETAGPSATRGGGIRVLDAGSDGFVPQTRLRGLMTGGDRRGRVGKRERSVLQEGGDRRGVLCVERRHVP